MDATVYLQKIKEEQTEKINKPIIDVLMSPSLIDIILEDFTNSVDIPNYHIKISFKFVWRFGNILNIETIQGSQKKGIILLYEFNLETGELKNHQNRIIREAIGDCYKIIVEDSTVKLNIW